MCERTTEAGDAQSGAIDVFRFSVDADADPGTLSRVLAPFSVLSIVPERIVMKRAQPGRVCILLDVRGLGVDRAELLAFKLSQIPLVHRAKAAASPRR